MNGITLQAKLYKGYAKAAQRVGTAFKLYRPTLFDEAISQGTLIEEEIFVALSQDKFFVNPSKYGNSVWQALLDGSLTKVFDYIQNDQGDTYFINSMPQIVPIQVIECNTIIDVVCPAQPVSVGVSSYSGNTVTSEEVLMRGWPASSLNGTKWERNMAGLPGDERNPWKIILLPFFPGVIIKTNYILIDEFRQRWSVSSAELSGFGWRITAGLNAA